MRYNVFCRFVNKRETHMNFCDNPKKPKKKFLWWTFDICNEGPGVNDCHFCEPLKRPNIKPPQDGTGQSNGGASMNNGKENWLYSGLDYNKIDDTILYYKAKADGATLAMQALQEECDKLTKKVEQLEMNRRVLNKYIDWLIERVNSPHS